MTEGAMGVALSELRMPCRPRRSSSYRVWALYNK